MTSLLMLVPLALTLLAIAAAAFVWAVRNDQFDDLGRPGHSILFDDDLERAPERGESDER